MTHRASAEGHRAGAAVLAVLVAASSIACGSTLLRQYEYEEDVTLSLDGSATIYVNASLPALSALRGVDLDLRPNARFDRERIEKAFSSPVTRVVRISNSRRLGRRYAHVRLEVRDIRELPKAALFAWSTYRFERTGTLVTFRQEVGASANREIGNAGWKGDEIVAFRLHLPSKITYHNAPSRTVERGNILTWEQPLTERRAGVPLTIEARMEPTSILYRTLWLFAISVLAALAVLAGIVWWVVRRA
jgi:hypothetical protein